MVKQGATSLLRQKSGIHGMGVFAGEEIPKGMSFYTVPTDNLYDSPQPRCAYIEGSGWVCDDKVLNWVNHSCNPNIAIVVKRGGVSLLALRDIQKAEEIVCDYDKTEVSGHKVKCRCRDKNCRGYFLRIEQ
jgi:SET domain-containing protein